MDGPRARDRRPLWALGLLAAVVAAFGIALAWTPASGPGTAETAFVTVTGPDGTIFEGVVDLDDATALGALAAAGEAGGFPFETRTYAQFGCGIYVRSIDGHQERGAHGWVYEVVREGGRTRPAMASCAFALQEGDEVHWVWDTA